MRVIIAFMLVLVVFAVGAETRKDYKCAVVDHNGVARIHFTQLQPNRRLSEMELLLGKPVKGGVDAGEAFIAEVEQCVLWNKSFASAKTRELDAKIGH